MQTVLVDKDSSIEVLFSPPPNTHPHGIHAMTPKMSNYSICFTSHSRLPLSSNTWPKLFITPLP